MIAWSIEAAKASGVFDRIICSTDDDEIAAIATSSGAEVPFRRPPELANDHATTDQVIQHALQWFAAQGTPLRYACCLYATAPFVRGSDLTRGLKVLQEARATTAFSVTTFAFPIFRALRVNDRGRLEMVWPEHRLTRSQDLPEAWHDAGQFYWMDVPKYLAEGRVYSEDAVSVPVPRWRVQDIDTLEDWERAEKMLAAMPVASKSENQ
jgi:N-acylneuraminate cytidylyltransferase